MRSQIGTIISTDAGLIAGKSVLITGGSRGIGLAIARVLAGQGARITLVARDRQRLERAAAELGADCQIADVSDASAVRRLASDTGPVPDVIVNSAGAFELATIAETSVESFDRQVAVNLRAVFLLAREFLPVMLERASGHIVTIGSIAGRHAFPANGAYSAAKFGVRGLHAVLQAELKGTGVRATLIEPAATATELWAAVDRSRHGGLPAAESMLSPEAVAQAVLYALSQPPEVAVPNLFLERS
ncbi:MAG: SDR family oxidoreductase [Longimicrobiales bacterium]